MLFICYALIAILASVVILYACLELHYFLRMCICVALASCKKKIHILQETRVTGICLTSDVDTFLFHMNNARYLRELDFARVDFFEKTGLYKSIKKKGGGLVIGATTIRYRRYVKLFQRYVVTTRIVYWDEQNIYMEHRFISPMDNFINTIVIMKARLINCNAEDVMVELLKTAGDVEDQKKRKPDIPLELEKWLESNAISSANLRNRC